VKMALVVPEEKPGAYMHVTRDSTPAELFSDCSRLSDKVSELLKDHARERFVSDRKIKELTAVQVQQQDMMESLRCNLITMTEYAKKYEDRNRVLKVLNKHIQEDWQTDTDNFGIVLERFGVYCTGTVEQFDAYFEQFETSLEQLNGMLLYVQGAVHDLHEGMGAFPPFTQDLYLEVVAPHLAEEERLNGIIRDLEQRVSASEQVMITPNDTGYGTSCDGSATAESCLLFTPDLFRDITAESDAKLERMRAIVDKGALDLKNTTASSSLYRVHAEKSILDLRLEKSVLMGQLQELKKPYDLDSFTGGTAFTDALLQLSDWKTQVRHLYNCVCIALLGVDQDVFSFSYFMNFVICEVELNISPFDQTLLDKCRSDSTPATGACFKPGLDILDLKRNLYGTTLHPSTHKDEFSAVLIQRILYLKRVETQNIRFALKANGVQLSPM